MSVLHIAEAPRLNIEDPFLLDRTDWLEPSDASDISQDLHWGVSVIFTGFLDFSVGEEGQLWNAIEGLSYDWGVGGSYVLIELNGYVLVDSASCHAGRHGSIFIFFFTLFATIILFKSH